MSEQQAPRPEDTPAVAGPEGTPGAQEQPPYGDPNDPYEKRYNDLRSWTDRVSQESADLRQQQEDWQRERELYQLMNFAEDEDTRRQAAQALGFEFEQEDSNEPAYYEDPYDAQSARMDALEQQWAERQLQEKEQSDVALMRAITDERMAQMAGDLDERSQNMILAYAINALPALNERGVPVPVPDIKGALDEFRAWETERQKAWVQSKRAPYVPPGGQEATEVPDLDSHQGRVDYALRQLQSAEQPE